MAVLGEAPVFTEAALGLDLLTEEVFDQLLVELRPSVLLLIIEP